MRSLLKFSKLFFILISVFLLFIFSSCEKSITETDNSGTENTIYNYMDFKFVSNEILSLEYAYDQNIVSQNDIRSIGYYHNGGKEWKGEIGEEVKIEDFIVTDYRPINKDPSVLSAEQKQKIKELYAQYLNDAIKYFYENQGLNIKIDLIKADDVKIIDYYGVYNDYAAVLIKHNDMGLQKTETPVIAGIAFYYPNSEETILLIGKLWE